MSPSKPNLVDTVREFRAGLKQIAEMASFASQEEEDAAAEQTYAPPMRALCRWDRPLESLDEVREAIRLAIDEDAIIDQIAEAPLRAALAYLDGRTA